MVTVAESLFADAAAEAVVTVVADADEVVEDALRWVTCCRRCTALSLKLGVDDTDIANVAGAERLTSQLPTSQMRRHWRC